MSSSGNGYQEDKMGSRNRNRDESYYTANDQGNPPKRMRHLSKGLNNVKENLGENKYREEQYKG